jgi:hypothetical protein
VRKTLTTMTVSLGNKHFGFSKTIYNRVFV